jgi:hypothetical protein
VMNRAHSSAPARIHPPMVFLLTSVVTGTTAAQP